MDYKNILEKTIRHLEGKKKILFLTTSNRWIGEGGDKAKSTLLAEKIAKQIGGKVTILDVPSLNIYPCEGNVSSAKGNYCGPKVSLLPDLEKNPSGCHRCWASANNPDDELWKISKELLQSDCVVFFGSVRWGQMNSFYQKLIERLTWLENRHSTLGEDNILKDIDAGLIITGHNWNEENVIKTQKQVLGFFGFKVIDDLCWYWRYTDYIEEESPESYTQAVVDFQKTFLDNE